MISHSAGREHSAYSILLYHLFLPVSPVIVIRGAISLLVSENIFSLPSFRDKSSLEPAVDSLEDIFSEHSVQGAKFRLRAFSTRSQVVVSEHFFGGANLIVSEPFCQRAISQ